MKITDKQLYELFTLGIIDGTAANNSTELTSKTKELFKYAADINDKATEFAREGINDYKNNSIPLHYLIYLSTLKDKAKFHSSFSSIVRNPDDVHKLLSYIKLGEFRDGVGRTIQNTINRWILDNLDAYWACRYKAKLNAISRITHLRTQMREGNEEESEDLAAYLNHIRNGKGIFPRIEALNQVYQDLELDNVTSRTLMSIREHKIVWEEIMHHIRYVEIEDKQRLYSETLKQTRGIKAIENFHYLEQMYDNPDEIEEETVEFAVKEAGNLKDADKIPLIFLYHKLSHPKVREAVLPHMTIGDDVVLHIDEMEVGEMPEEIRFILNYKENAADIKSGGIAEKILVITKENGEKYLGEDWGKRRGQTIIWQLEEEPIIERSGGDAVIIVGTDKRSQYQISGLIQEGKYES